MAHDAGQTTHEDGRRPMTIGHLNDSDDFKILSGKKKAFVFHQKPVNTLCQINHIGFIINESFSYVLHYVSTQP